MITEIQLTKPPLTLQALTITTSPNIDASVIWLHGLGADGHDFEPVVQALQLANIRFILPHAPSRPVTLNGGYVMPAWYDIYSLDRDSKQDEAGIKETSLQIEALIENEIALGIPAERIVIAGFSQGGAIALYTLTRYTARLAGALALSTYLPLKAQLASEAQAANRNTPILMAHGQFDEVISLETCMHSLEVLQNEGYNVEFKKYSMAHTVSLEEIADIRTFLLSVLTKDNV